MSIEGIIPRDGTPSPPIISTGASFADLLTVSGEISVDTLGAPSPLSSRRRLCALAIPARPVTVGGAETARSSPMATALQARKSLRKGVVSSATCSSPQATALQRRKMRKRATSNDAMSGVAADIMRLEASSPQATALQKRKSCKNALQAGGGLSAAAAAIVGAHSGASRAEASSPQATALQRRKMVTADELVSYLRAHEQMRPRVAATEPPALPLLDDGAGA